MKPSIDAGIHVDFCCTLFLHAGPRLTRASYVPHCVFVRVCLYVLRVCLSANSISVPHTSCQGSHAYASAWKDKTLTRSHVLVVGAKERARARLSRRSGRSTVFCLSLSHLPPRPLPSAVLWVRINSHIALGTMTARITRRTTSLLCAQVPLWAFRCCPYIRNVLQAEPPLNRCADLLAVFDFDCFVSCCLLIPPYRWFCLRYAVSPGAHAWT